MHSQQAIADSPQLGARQTAEQLQMLTRTLEVALSEAEQAADCLRIPRPWADADARFTGHLVRVIDTIKEATAAVRVGCGSDNTAGAAQAHSPIATGADRAAQRPARQPRGLAAP